MLRITRARKTTAQSLIETVVGIIFMVPVALFLFDIAVLVMANTANDNLAKSVARAAASAKDTGTNEGTPLAGFNAANQIANNFAESGLIQKPSSGSFLAGYAWNGNGTADSQGSSWPSRIPTPNVGDVGVVTSMQVKLPVPFPFLPSTIDFEAKAVEPIVSIAAIGAGFGDAPSGDPGRPGPTGSDPGVRDPGHGADHHTPASSTQ